MKKNGAARKTKKNNLRKKRKANNFNGITDHKLRVANYCFEFSDGCYHGKLLHLSHPSHTA